MAKLNKNVIAAMLAIQASGRASQAVGEPLVKSGLIEVNTADINDAGEAAARWTQKGFDSMPKNETVTAGASSGPSKFAIITNAVLPESKRGFGRVAGTSKYPFAELIIGGSFFVANNEVEGGDAVTKLTSTVSNMNNKYRTPTGESETKERTKRGEGNKAVLDAEGKKVKETVTVPKYTQDRKFSIRPVKEGVAYGGWTAPADGALIGRVS